MDWQYIGPVYEMKDQPVTCGDTERTRVVCCGIGWR